MVQHPKKISYPTGTWYQIQAVVEEQSKETGISVDKIESDIARLISERKLEIMHTSGTTFVNAYALSEELSYYVEKE